MIREIKNPDRRQIRNKIVGLSTDPEKQGKALVGDLEGLRSIGAAGGRYRVIYQVRKQVIEVLVLAAGIGKEGDRRDIYRLAQKLIRQRLA